MTSSWVKQVPNWLTIARVLLIPVVIIAYWLPWKHHGIASALVFAAAGVTDWLDGYLARKMNSSSAFGAFLDPVADKLMVTACMILLAVEYSHPLLTVSAVIIIGREITVSALREWMAELGQRGVVKVTWVAKFKTGLQMAAVALLLAAGSDSNNLYLWGGCLALALAVLLTLQSMLQYLRAAAPNFSRQHPDDDLR